MRCPHCESKNDDQAVYCAKCGQWILSKYQHEAIKPPYHSSWRAKRNTHKKRTVSPKVWTVVVAAMIFIICMIVLLWPEGQSPVLPTTPSTTGRNMSTIPVVPPPTSNPEIVVTDYIMVDKVITPMLQDGKLGFLVDDAFIPAPTEQTLITSMAGSLDGNSAAVLSGNTLLYIHGHEVQQIATDVIKYQLSTDGSGLAYLDTTGTLWLYRDGQRDLIFEHKFPVVQSFCISADGNTVSYVVLNPLSSSLEHSYIVYQYHNGQLWEIGPIGTYFPIATANDGSYVYLMNGTAQLSIITLGGSMTPLGKVQAYSYLSSPWTSKEDSFYIPAIYFNADQSQVLYVLDDGTYLSVDGQSGVKISNNALAPIIPDGAKYLTSMNGNFYPHVDFEDQFYDGPNTDGNSISANIYYLPKGEQAHAVATHVTQYHLSPTHKYLYVLQLGGTLGRIQYQDNVIWGGIAAYVEDFVVTNDCSAVYYRSGRNIIRSDESGETILATVQSAKAMLVVLEDNSVGVYEDGVLTHVWPNTN